VKPLRYRVHWPEDGVELLDLYTVGDLLGPIVEEIERLNARLEGAEDRSPTSDPVPHEEEQ